MSRRRKTPGYVERRGKGYRISLCVAGKRYRYTWETPNRADAEDFARRRYEELVRSAGRAYTHAALAPKDPTDMLSLIDRYEEKDSAMRKAQTHRCYGVSLGPLREYFRYLGNPDATTITPAQLVDYASWRRTHHPDGIRGRRPTKERTEEKVRELKSHPKRTTPISDRTVQKDLRVLRRVFRRAQMEYIRLDNPVVMAIQEIPKPPKFNPVILSDQELTNLLQAAEPNPMLWFYTLLLAESGMRSDSEALFLRWEDFKLDEGVIHIATGRDDDGVVHPISRPGDHDTKNQQSRDVPITPTLRKAIIEHSRFAKERYGAEYRTSPWVFHHLTTLRGIPAGDRIVSFRKPFLRAARDAKVRPGFRQHDLRHRRVTTWLGAGIAV